MKLQEMELFDVFMEVESYVVNAYILIPLFYDVFLSDSLCVLSTSIGACVT